MTRKQIKALPKYVSLCGTAMRLYNEGQANGWFGRDEKHVTYYRDAGAWDVEIIISNGKPIASIPKIKNLDGKPLIRITKAQWRRDNRGYISKSTQAYEIK